MAPGTLTESLAETLRLFGGSGEPRTTTEIAEELDLGRRSTYDRLDRLVERDRLETKKVGANARVWWRPREVAADRSATDWPRAAESLIDDVLADVAVGVFVLDDDFEVAWLNETAERYFGIDRADALGRDKRELVTGRIAPSVEDSATFAETVLATYDDNTYTERFECHVQAGEGRESRWLEHRSKPIETGEYAGGRVELYYDVTDRKVAERERRENRAEFESLVEALDEHAIVRLDPDGRIRTWNEGARRITGHEEREIVDEPMTTVYAEAARAASLDRLLATAARDGTIEEEGWCVRADGTRFWANVTITAIRNDDGDLQGFGAVLRDTTDRHEQEARLRRERRLTDQLLETAPVRLAVFDDDGTLERVNSRLREQLDVEAVDGGLLDGVPTYDEAGNRLAPDGHPIQQVIESEESVSGMVVRHEDADGEERWTSLTASPLFDADGDLDRIVVAESDITDLKRTERQLERQRDELAAELDDVFARVDDGFFALDSEWRFVHVNDRAETVLERSREELIGRSVWEAFPNAVGTTFQEEYERAMETQESVTFEEYYPPLDAWFQIHAYPSAEGLSVYFRDVTDRKETELALRDSEQRYRRLFESIDEGLCIVEMRFDGDEPVDYRFLETNPAFADHTGLQDVEGERITDLAPDYEDHWFEVYGRVARDHEPERFTAKSGALDERWFDVYAFPIGCPDDDQVGILFTDITDRIERERELERYETIVETIWDGVYALDPDENFVMVNDAFLELTGYDREELLGEPGKVVHNETVNEAASAEAERIVDGEQDGAVLEFDLERKDGETIPVESRFGPYQYDEDRYGRCGVVRDVTARKEYERYLEDAKEQLEAATEAGAVGTFEWRVQEDVMVTGPAFAKTFGVDPTAAREGVSLDRFVERIHEDDRERVQRAIERAVETGGDYEEEYRVKDADGEYRWVVARGHVECDEEGEPVTFPGALTDITARKEAELELERQRGRLAALNNLNQVVREITDAVIEQSTRAEIERTVCERLADSGSYSFAWTGDVGTDSETVEVRAQAGTDGYLDDVTITVDRDDPRSQGPTGRALRTGEVQVTDDMAADDRHEPWREHIRNHDVRSSAAIPIAHEDTVYGVLNVYANRPRAFSGQELDVIAQLGEIVGHAIAATERKQALMSDELIELAFRIEDVFETLDVDVDRAGRITIDRTIALGDGEYLVYGTATEEAAPAVEALVATLDHWESVEIDRSQTPATFEVRLTDPPVLSAVASLGGYVAQAVIEEGDYRMRLHLAPGVDVRQVIDAVEATYSSAEMLRRRQITRTADDRHGRPRDLVTDLTERQRTALEAAFYAGFFEWPRDASGEEVADSIGVAAPTFHQHLRKAERKVFEAILIPNAERTGES